LGTVYRSGSVVSHLSIFFRKPKLSILLKAEARLGLYVCQQTGEIQRFSLLLLYLSFMLVLLEYPILSGLDQ